MKQPMRSLVLAAAALVLGAGAARADGTRSWNVCGGNAFNTCASVMLTVTGSNVTIKVWNRSGFNSSFASTVFTAVGFEGIGSNVAAVGANPIISQMSGPVRPGNTPQAWRLRNNTQVGGGIKLDVVSSTTNGINNGVASACAPANTLPNGSTQLWMNPCAAPTGPSDAGWVSISFQITGTWDVANTWLLVKGQNGPNGASTECMTGGESMNCTDITVTPEPVTMVLLGSGLAGMGGIGFLRRRRRDSDAA